MNDHATICEYLEETLEEMPETFVFKDAATGEMGCQPNREKQQLKRIIADFRERNPWAMAEGYCIHAEQLAQRVKQLEAMIPQASQVLHRRNAELQRQLDEALKREEELHQIIRNR
jgi:hypothetical protein